MEFKCFGQIHLFAGHDGKVQSVKEAASDDATNYEDDPSGLRSRMNEPTLQSCDGIYPFELEPSKVLRAFECVSFPHGIIGSEHPPAISGELMFAR